MLATIKSYSCFCLLLSLASSLLNHAYAQKYIGDRCSMPQGPGVCQLIDKCPSAYAALRSGNRPENCGFQDSTPIVCCPSENPPPPRATTVWAWEVVMPKVTTRPVNSLSKQVCTEYNQLFFNPQYLVRLGKRRIIMGTAAMALEFPHMAAIGFNTNSSITWDCGGTLISDRFVLTAAHCLYHIQWGSAEWVRLGYLGPNQATVELEFWPQVLRIIEKIRHPEYNSLRRYNDIALLRLERLITFTPFIKPACLDTKENYSVGDEAIATGWGLTNINDGYSRSANLLKVEVPIAALSKCASFYNVSGRLPYGIDDRTQICAGGNGKDTCQGDSGGPLVMKTTPLSLHHVIGITSFGESCGSVVPGVYTRVSFYLSWIEGVVWPDRLV